MAFGLATLALTGGLAAQTLSVQTRETPLYRVELIIFAHEPGAGGATEDFLAEPPTAAISGLAPIELTVSPRSELEPLEAEAPEPLLAPVELPPRLRPPPPLEPIELPTWRQRLDTGAGELASLHRRLTGRTEYRPLLHVIWVQVAETDGITPLIDLSALRPGSEELVGQVRLSRTRFLHLHLDLEFLAPDRGLALPLPVGGGELPEVRLLIPRYQIDESRRMRSGELHYFDHPAFGVIATVQPVERPPVSGVTTR